MGGVAPPASHAATVMARERSDEAIRRGRATPGLDRFVAMTARAAGRELSTVTMRRLARHVLLLSEAAPQASLAQQKNMDAKRHADEPQSSQGECGAFVREGTETKCRSGAAA
jgi:hypothetical protein